MTQAITNVEAFGREIDEALTGRFEQTLILYTTGAATDLVYDFGNYVAGSLGTFWTAVAATAATAGAYALQCIQAIAPLVNNFERIDGPTLAPLVKAGTGSVQTLTSSSITNATSASATVTGLLSTDIILSAQQSTANSGAVVPVAFGTPTANTLPLTYASAPGTGGAVTVTFLRPSGTITAPAGGYVETLANSAPNITFGSGTGPTTGVFYLVWDLKSNCHPVMYPIPKP